MASSYLKTSNPEQFRSAVIELPGYSTVCFSDGVTWTIWLDRSQRCASTTEFTAGLRKIYTISSMQVLLTVCENILPVSELSNRHSYHFMLGQRRPVWEDPENSNGGTWSFRCAKTDTEHVWRSLLEAIITGRFNQCIAPGDRLVGFSVGVRETEDVVHVWNIDADKASSATLIDAVITFLPKITFRNVMFKPFKEKTQTTKKNGGESMANGKRKEAKPPKGVLLKNKDDNKLSKPLKSVSFCDLLVESSAGHGDGHKNSFVSPPPSKNDSIVRAPLVSRYQNNQ